MTEEPKDRNAYDPKVRLNNITSAACHATSRWVNPQRLNQMTFIGKDVFAVAHDIYIILFNYKTNTETVYVANNQKRGDGVDVLAGHRSYMFAFAEKVRYARIFIISYPSLTVVAEIKDPEVIRYKGICMMESDLIAAFSGFPQYLVTVWCWRTNQRASRTHMLICQCWSEGVNVWEVARCYKKCFMLKRQFVAAADWDTADQPMVAGICWSLEGQLYAIDGKANLFGLSSDGIALVKTLEWSEKIKGNRQTSICSFLNGLLIYGPDQNLRVTKNLFQILMKEIKALDVSFEASPADPLLAIFGEVNGNYGVVLQTFEHETGLKKQSSMCLTYQIVSRVAFSQCGRYLVAAAMSAGHIFIFKVSTDYNLNLVRYTELGRGLADCFLMKVGEAMRCFSLVLFSEKYSIGERVICVNAETGKDNKFAGKMQGPYSRLLPLSNKDTIIAIPHLSKHMHILKISGEKGLTVSVKMGPIIESGHDIKQFDGFRGANALVTFGYDGVVILRPPHASEEYDLKLTVAHRYEYGVKNVVMDANGKFFIHLAVSGTVACTFLQPYDRELGELVHNMPSDAIYNTENINNTLIIIQNIEKNYLDVQEDKKVHEEAMDYKRQRDEVVKVFTSLQKKLVDLLEENINERPLHQLSLSEFNLHQEAKKERLRAAEKEREEIRLQTEARIRAQDKVTAWIKQKCWDTIQVPRIKIFAIFSHYHVESYPMLPSQRDTWAELQQIEALRTIEKENDANMFRPWLEQSLVETPSKQAEVPAPSMTVDSITSFRDTLRSVEGGEDDVAVDVVAEPYVLSGTNAHRFVSIPPFMIPQMEAFSFLQMNWLYHIVQFTTQNMRKWFNKQFEELMQTKKREVALVTERNARLRFIIEELNKLSDLRGSFHHLIIEIHDPQWRQEEHVEKLIKVEPEECSIEPYISPSQIVIVPPDPGPKDDFRERALMDMMDGVLEKLWHEEIKKPIPMPQCMVRDTWLTKIKVDSVIGQENLNLMRLRRINLDRIVMSEVIEEIRDEIALYERELEKLNSEFQEIQEQSQDCQAAYEALTAKDRQMDKTFKNHFADLSPIIVDQAYKFFKRRPKWHQRVTMIPVVLYELAFAVATGTKPPLLHPDCFDFFKGMEQLDQISNMPTVMDEHIWNSMCKLRRAKTENEIRTRALIQEMTFVDSAINVWSKAIHARRSQLVTCQGKVSLHRETVELEARNKTVQGILSKEWEHAQMKMKLRHMKQELYSYQRLKIPKELQLYLKNKELGYTDEQDYIKMEKENEASKVAVNKILNEQIHRSGEIEVKLVNIEKAVEKIEKLITHLNVKVSEKKLNEDALEPIKIRRVFKKRMETLVMRSRLIREVQANHSTIVMLQTELELLRLKTYPTLASFRTY
ncbi:hypothetical protein HF086_008238 [Spodoptera exigua]|uniref:Cilia- and flagella-associated protein 43 n=1 Tax=Spodoptera exigua TaxID=7107 RepID=A0A922SG02_SPOEX|nr:hypothetical protein HF086_008238 [Spodoptera exigua]